MYFLHQLEAHGVNFHYIMDEQMQTNLNKLLLEFCQMNDGLLDIIASLQQKCNFVSKSLKVSCINMKIIIISIS
jgi:hypothetical protein